MKLNHTVLLLAVVLAAGDRVTQAGVIYYDNFSGTAAALAGRTPTVDVGSNTWAANSAFSTDGSKVVVSGPGGDGVSAYLPFIPQSGLVYAVSANLSPTSFEDTSADWLSLGFGSFSTPSQFHAFPNSAAPWLLTTNDGTANSIVDPATSLTAGHTSTSGGVTNYELVLDTTGAQWKATWLYNNITYANYTYTPATTPNPTITGVAIGSYLENGTIDNFELQTVPEPSTCLLLLVGLAGLWLSRRKRS